MMQQFKKEIGEAGVEPPRRRFRKAMMDACLDLGLCRTASLFASAFEKGVFEDSMRRSIYEKLKSVGHDGNIVPVLDLVNMGGFGNDGQMMRDIVKKTMGYIATRVNDSDYLRVFMKFPEYLEEFETIAAGRGLGNAVKQAARELMVGKELYDAVGEGLGLRAVECRDGAMSIIQKWARERAE